MDALRKAIENELKAAKTQRAYIQRQDWSSRAALVEMTSYWDGIIDAYIWTLEVMAKAEVSP